MESIGVRELRQDASRWLRRVESGESFHVTVRGRRVALLLPAHDQGLAALEAAGEITDAEVDLLDVAPGPGAGASERLARMREDER